MPRLFMLRPNATTFISNSRCSTTTGMWRRCFRSALTRAINQFGQNQGLFKDVKENLQGEDVREGLVAVISVKLPQPQFEGQTKGKLNSDIQSIVSSFVYERLMEYFEK